MSPDVYLGDLQGGAKKTRVSEHSSPIPVDE